MQDTPVFALFDQNRAKIVSMDGSASTWRIAQEVSPYEDIDAEVSTFDGTLILTRLRRTYFTTAAPARTSTESPLFVREYRFHDFTRFDTGYVAPNRVEIRYDVTTSEGDFIWQRNTVELISVEPRSGDIQFDIDYPDGTSLWDERYRIGFVTGDRILNLDGRVYQVDRPLTADAGEDLAAILATAMPVEPQDSQRTSRVPLAVAVALALLGLIIAFPTVFGKRRETSKC